MGNYLDIFSLAGKVGIVTGGGRGLGLGIARALAGGGSDLMLVSRSENELREAAESICRESGRRIEILTADVTSTDLSAIVRETVDRFGRLDILVNNAGATFGSPFSMSPNRTMRPSCSFS